MKKNTYREKIDEIKKLYPALYHHSDPMALQYYHLICEDQLINEFVTRTINIDKTTSELTSRFDNKIDKIETKKARTGKNIFDDKVLFLTFLNAQLSIIDDVNIFMDTFGWFPAAINNIDKYSRSNLDQHILNDKPIDIRYEAKYDHKVSIKGPLYHLTPDIAWSKIETMGLTPKTKSKLTNHPERIYLMKPLTRNAYNQLVNLLFKSLDDYTKSIIKKYHVLEIDTTYLTDDIFNFYKDPNFNYGVWTYQNIPPKYIKSIYTILV